MGSDSVSTAAGGADGRSADAAAVNDPAAGGADSAPTLLSGMQPSGESLHLGNYLGALKNWVQLQDQQRSFLMVANLHSITAAPEPQQLKENTLKTAAQYLAAGIDPAKSTLFVQSQVRAHNQLAWIMETLCGFGEASRMTQFKDKSAKQQNASVGLFTYPMLMAADILLYQATLVPVGDDQKQHLELAQTLAERFNRKYGDVFAIPRPLIMTGAARIYDLQNPAAKMSKSAASDAGLIGLLDEPEVIRRKIMRAVTDAESHIAYDPQARPGISNLLTIYAALSGGTAAAAADEYASAGYGTFKKSLAELVVDTCAPIRERTFELLDDRGQLERLLSEAAERAAVTAEQTLRRTYDRLGIL